MSVLLKSAICDWLAKGKEDPARGLVITPLLDKEKQIGANSVDVRLGNEFIVIKQRSLTSLDATKASDVKQEIDFYQERLRISFHDKFVLHPRQLVLAATLEYISLPEQLSAQVQGRSSWGRLGLIIATAPVVAPGFKGCITLELENLGEVPIVLYPGLCIAQLVFETTEGGGAYSGRYSCPTGPQFSNIAVDAAIEWWGTRSPLT